MSKPIRVVTTKATGRWSTGVELGFANTADADKILGENAYKVVAYQDGTEWTPPKRETKSEAKEDASTSADAERRK